MSRLLLARHGQTEGFLAGGYVDLTETGRAQARALGAFLARRGLVPDAVYVGPRPRHAQSHDAAVDAAGGGWPEPSRLPGLDEHQGLEMLARVLQQPGRHDALRDALLGARGADRMRAFQRAMRAWVAGELDVEGVEDWSAFRARVGATLDILCEGRGRTVVAFTSGGFVGCATAAVLGLDDDGAALELGFAVENASLTMVRYSEARRSLHRFNTVPHLGDAAPITGV